MRTRQNPGPTISILEMGEMLNTKFIPLKIEEIEQ